MILRRRLWLSHFLRRSWLRLHPLNAPSLLFICWEGPNCCCCCCCCCGCGQRQSSWYPSWFSSQETWLTRPRSGHSLDQCLVSPHIQHLQTHHPSVLYFYYLICHGLSFQVLSLIWIFWGFPIPLPRPKSKAPWHAPKSTTSFALVVSFLSFFFYDLCHHLWRLGQLPLALNILVTTRSLNLLEDSIRGKNSFVARSLAKIIFFQWKPQIFTNALRTASKNCCCFQVTRICITTRRFVLPDQLFEVQICSNIPILFENC